jgi:DNA-binding transcriptional LysR family regulator
MPRKLDADSQIGRRLRLRDLHLFFTVMQRESMAKAAKQLGMSQPAVSAVIGNLEHTLGVRLFDRRPQGVTPTLYGQALLRRGSAAFDELKQAIRDIDGLADPSAGEILVGAPESIAASILPAIIDRVVQRHRRIVVHVTQVSTATLDFRELRERTLDIVIARIDALLDAGSLGEDLLVEKLFDDRIVFATGAASKWARRKSVRIADLRDAPWILTPPGTINAAIVSDAFKAAGLPVPEPNLVTFSAHLRTHLAASGKFITAIPFSMLRANADQFGLKALPIKLPLRPWPVAIVMLKNRTLSPIVDRFIECAREVGKGMTAAK